MLSPVKVITAAALIFAIGGAFLIAQPFDDQWSSVPGGATDDPQDESADPVSPVWVTDTVQYAPSCSGPAREFRDGVIEERDYRCEPQRWTSSDPRLGGSATITWNADVYRADDGNTYSVYSTEWDVRDDAGGWLCQNPDGLDRGASLFTTSLQGSDKLTCVGRGDYEGLTAILILHWIASPKTIEGLIIPGEVPSAPDLSTEE